jgi:hypothetical protein
MTSSENGMANPEFAWYSREAASKESRQTASLPYTGAAIFILSGLRNGACRTPQKIKLEDRGSKIGIE